MRWAAWWMGVALAAAGCGRSADSEVGACALVETWQDNPAPAAVVQAFEDELAESTAQGVAWAILQDGQIVYAGAAGYRDAAAQLPMQPDTLLRTGSSLKMQTAALALAVASRGELTLDEPIATWLPDFELAVDDPAGAEQATVHQLLSHQGGYYDYTPIDGPAGPRALYDHAHGFFADTFWMLAPPGSFWNYSNPNFSLAGLVAQEASGVTYTDAMRRDVWGPLCMDASTFDADEVIASGNYAVARTTDWLTGQGTVRVEPDSYDHGFARPAGFGWGTVLDQLRFAHLLLGGEPGVLPEASVAMLTEPHVDTLEFPDGRLGYGYGVFVNSQPPIGRRFRDELLWEHGGDIPGFASDLWVFPEHGVAIAVLANGSGAHFTDALAAAARAMIPLRDGQEPDLSPSTALLDAVAGTWDDPNNLGRVALTRDGDRLTVSAPRLDDAGVPYGAMTPLSANALLWSVQGMQLPIVFVDGEDGQPRWLRHRAFAARRVDDPAVTAAPWPPGHAVEAALRELRRGAPSPLEQALRVAPR